MTYSPAPLLGEDATNALEGEYIVQLHDHLSGDEGSKQLIIFFLLLKALLFYFQRALISRM